jgi:hypothetical protein
MFSLGYHNSANGRFEYATALSIIQYGRYDTALEQELSFAFQV